jgi:hypothetical protein
MNKNLRWIAVAMILLAGCHNRGGKLPAGDIEVPPETAPVALFPLEGTWTVVAHHLPAASAMTEAEAQGWMGRTLVLSATEVTSGDTHCINATYSRRTVDRDEFLSTAFHLSPGTLDRLQMVNPITVTSVLCGGQTMEAMGGVIIEVDAAHILTPWNGVFFELARAPGR